MQWLIIINWLQKYKDDPTLPSAGSTAQVSQANFRTGVPPTSIIGKDGDSIEIVINGNQILKILYQQKTTTDYRQVNFGTLYQMVQILNANGNERALYSLVSGKSTDNLSRSSSN